MKINFSCKNDITCFIDFCNFLFIVIVIFLHLPGYTFDYFYILSKFQINIFLQKFAVGGFLFLSGLKLSLFKHHVSYLLFFKNRFYKIYILYFLSLNLSYFTSYPYLNNQEFPSFLNYIKHVFLLQAVFPELFGHNFHTLWFVSVIFICYILYLIYNKILNKIYLFVICQIIFFFIFLLIHLITYEESYKLFFGDFPLYLTFFSFGMLFSNSIIVKIFEKYSVYMVVFCIPALFIFLNFVYVNNFFELCIYSFLVLCSNIGLYSIIIEYFHYFPFCNNNILKIVSHSSFSIFLFHRPILTIFDNFYSDRSFYQWLYIVCFGLPIMFFISFWLQCVYDFYFKFLFKRS